MALWDVVRKAQSVSLAAREREVAPSLHTTRPWLSQPPSQRQLPLDALVFTTGGLPPRAPSLGAEQSLGLPSLPLLQ